MRIGDHAGEVAPMMRQVAGLVPEFVDARQVHPAVNVRKILESGHIQRDVSAKPGDETRIDAASGFGGRKG